MKNRFISNLHDSDAETDATNLRSVKLLLSGSRGNIGKLNSFLNMNNNKIVNLESPENENDGVNNKYVDEQVLFLDGSKPMKADLNMRGKKIEFISEPTQDNET